MGVDTNDTVSPFGDRLTHGWRVHDSRGEGCRTENAIMFVGLGEALRDTTRTGALPLRGATLARVHVSKRTTSHQPCGSSLGGAHIFSFGLHGLRPSTMAGLNGPGGKRPGPP